MAKSDLRTCQVCGTRKDLRKMTKVGSFYSCDSMLGRCVDDARKALEYGLTIRQYLKHKDFILAQEEAEKKKEAELREQEAAARQAEKDKRRADERKERIDAELKKAKLHEQEMQSMADKKAAKEKYRNSPEYKVIQEYKKYKRKQWLYKPVIISVVLAYALLYLLSNVAEHVGSKPAPDGALFGFIALMLMVVYGVKIVFAIIAKIFGFFKKKG